MAKDIDAMIEQLRPEIEKNLQHQLGKTVAESLSWSLKSNVEEFAMKYVQEFVLPDVEIELKKKHSEIVVAIVAAVKISCDKLAESLTEKTAKKIANSYTIGKIAKELFD